MSGHRERTIETVTRWARGEHVKQYRDADDRPVSLDTLCRKEPAWAANRIRAEREENAAMRARAEKAEALANALEADVRQISEERDAAVEALRNIATYGPPPEVEEDSSAWCALALARQQKALRLCHELRRGPVSSERFKAHGMKPSDWKRSGYVVPVRDEAGKIVKEGRNTVWEIAQPEHCYFPDKGYEAERDAIAAAECEGAAS